MNSRIRYLIICFSLVLVFCYLLFLLLIEILNFKNLKRILATFDIEKLEFQKDLPTTRYDSVYNNNPHYLSKNWYIQKNI